ncbi:MAG: hypothetical protein IJC68_04300 [Firmicutes bacterium]|nr:hypothetical protein [Bacillota bacterium]
MFDQKQIDAYRSIAAPAQQRRRIMNLAAEKEPVPFFRTAGFRSLSAAAACLVLVVALTVLGPGHAAPEFSMDGTPITAEAVILPQNSHIATLASAGDRNSLVIPLTLDGKEETLLSASAGVLTVTDPETADTLFTGETGSVSQPVSISWELPADEAAAPRTLTAETADHVCTITVTFDAAENCWFIHSSVE